MAIVPIWPMHFFLSSLFLPPISYPISWPLLFSSLALSRPAHHIFFVQKLAPKLQQWLLLITVFHFLQLFFTIVVINVVRQNSILVFPWWKFSISRISSSKFSPHHWLWDIVVRTLYRKVSYELLLQDDWASLLVIYIKSFPNFLKRPTLKFFLSFFESFFSFCVISCPAER